MLRIEQVAAMLAVSRRTVYRMLDAGQLPEPIRFGKRMLRWLSSQITEWIAKGCPARSSSKRK
jgi:excisionase family DNA binding protein